MVLDPVLLLWPEQENKDRQRVLEKWRLLVEEAGESSGLFGTVVQASTMAEAERSVAEADDPDGASPWP